jgi:hypothetical protein
MYVRAMDLICILTSRRKAQIEKRDHRERKRVVSGIIEYIHSCEYVCIYIVDRIVKYYSPSSIIIQKRKEIMKLSYMASSKKKEIGGITLKKSSCRWGFGGPLQGLGLRRCSRALARDRIRIIRHRHHPWSRLLHLRHGR